MYVTCVSHLSVAVCCWFQWFRNAVGGDPEMVNSLTELIFSRLDPLYEFHTALLKEIDQRVTAWYDLCVCLCVCECARVRASFE